jgi:hypothetical protein
MPGSYVEVRDNCSKYIALNRTGCIDLGLVAPLERIPCNVKLELRLQDLLKQINI